MFVEMHNTVSGNDLVPANMALGAMVKLSLPVLVNGYENEQPLTIPDIRKNVSYPSGGIRVAVKRMTHLYLPCEPENDGADDKYTNMLYETDDPSEFYILSEPGYEWSKLVLSSFAKKRDRSFKITTITSVVKKLPEA